MREIGKVVAVNNGIAKVEIKRHTACGNCGACQVGQDKLVMETLAKNTISADIGDQVEIETETTNVLKASLIIYTFPLIMFIIGCLIGYGVANYTNYQVWNNYIGFGTGLVFTLISYLIIRKNEKKFINDKAFQPTICRIVN